MCRDYRPEEIIECFEYLVHISLNGPHGGDFRKLSKGCSTLVLPKGEAGDIYWL